MHLLSAALWPCAGEPVAAASRPSLSARTLRRSTLQRRCRHAEQACRRPGSLSVSAAAAAAPDPAQPERPAPPRHTAAALPAAVERFLDAFDSQRSVEAMLACCSEEVAYHNLNLPQPAVGRQAVGGVLAALVAGAPPGWRLAVDAATAGGAAAAVVLHFVVGSGAGVPLSRGIAFYRLDQAGLICSITEASEQVLKVPQATLPALGAAAPLLQALGSGPLAGLVPGAAGAGAAAAAAAAARPRPFAPAPPAGQAGGMSSSVGMSSSAGSRSSSSAGSLNFSSSSSRAGAGWAPGSSAPVGRGGAAAAGGGPSPTTSSSGDAADGLSGTPGGGGGDVGGLAGVWLKDLSASDLESYGRACDLMQLSGLQKTTAMQLIEGLEVEQQGREVAVRFLTVVPFFKVTEAYRLDGPSSMARRDLRGGQQRATAKVTPEGGLSVEIAWGEPNAGSVSERYSLLEGGAALECVSTVAVAAGSVTTRTVYRRSTTGWRPRFQWNPLYSLMGGGSGQ